MSNKIGTNAINLIAMKEIRKIMLVLFKSKITLKIKKHKTF